MKKPKLTHNQACAIIDAYPLPHPVKLLGLRGYYKRTMGNPTCNDRGIYDDAIFILSPEFFAAFNANTDPSVYRKSIATLKFGSWLYKKGIHKLNSPSGYMALVQAEKVTVLRDGCLEDTGWFGINIHRGSYHSTSSLGCQTIYPSQWDSFITDVYSQMKRYDQHVIPYVLTSLSS